MAAETGRRWKPPIVSQSTFSMENSPMLEVKLKRTQGNEERLSPVHDQEHLLTLSLISWSMDIQKHFYKMLMVLKSIGKCK